MNKSKIVFLSDVHIGTNSPTVWYQKRYHEPYLLAMLDWVIENANSISELVILGDFIDFWTYPCDQVPPTFLQIIADNPKLFEQDGKLNQVLTALNGNISYVRGNHDMTITQDDLNHIPHPNGFKIKLVEDNIYFPLGKNDRKLVCTHGHHYTMFNREYNSPQNSIAPLPLGFYITRSVATMRYNEYQVGKFNNVAQLPDSGDPNGMVESLSRSVLSEVISKGFDFSLARTLLNAIASKTGVGLNQPIKIADGKVTDIQKAIQTYENLWTEWEEEGKNYEQPKYAYKSALADLNGSYMGWFAQLLAFTEQSSLVVMGHTHKPIFGLKNAQIGYVNTGFSCPSIPDIGKKFPTFIVVDYQNIDRERFELSKCAEIMAVVENQGNYKIQPLKAESANITEAELPGGIPMKLQDCSCYVTISNTSKQHTFKLAEVGNKYGGWTVKPPEIIHPGETVTFWLQDYEINGAEGGKVIYKTEIGSTLKLKFNCPYGLPNILNPTNANQCSASESVTFYTKSGSDEDWGKPNEVKKKGHPFFVKFIV
ncbi:MAG: metallophosphoesterase [Nostoc sp.]